jgi:hypothetical protein
VRGLRTDLARAAGAARPEALAVQLSLVYDGATVAADLDGDPAAAADAARRAAEALVDGALGAAPAP